MSVTLSDIAEKAGVSRAAVSKALNDKSDISSSLKKKIRKIADETGYVVNIAAKTLSTRKTGTIGVVLAFPQIPTVAERILGIQDCMAENSYLSMVSFHNGDLANEINQVRMLQSRIDGLIITPINQDISLAEALKSLHVPLVLMNETLTHIESDYVGDDDEEGGCIGALHLLESARGRIAYLGNREDYPSDQAALRGIRRALNQKKHPAGDLLPLWNNSTPAEIEKNISALLRKSPEIKGIFAFNDMSALWAMESLAAHGVKVPERMKIIGYDNIDFAAMARIPLTSISQPNRQIGYQAASLLLERIKNPAENSSPVKKVIFPPSLVIRDSSI